MGTDDEIRQTGPRKRSLSVNGRQTSIAITDEMWGELREIAKSDGVSANQIVTRIREMSRGNLGRAIRMYVVNRRTHGQCDGNSG